MPDMLDAPVVDQRPYRHKNVLYDEDVAAILGKPLRTIQDMARQNQLPEPLFGAEHKQGQQRMWSAAYFFRWLDSNGKARR